MRPRKEILNQISNLVEQLSVEEKEILVKKIQEPQIPVSIFNSNLSCLELIVVYLKENLNMEFAQISKILDRAFSTIYLTYRNARKKSAERLRIEGTIGFSPFLFKDRKYSVMELVVSQLHDKNKVSFTKISKMLNRKYTTISSTYYNYSRKHGR